MGADSGRELTTLEYVVLGLIGTEPQSGYSIISSFEDDVYRRWSASPGSIYPMLKRLEKRGIIAGELEVIHETRPRKMYSLTPQGEDLLGEWLRKSPNKFAVTEERDITLLRFLFAEKRMSREEVLCWLDDYDEAIQAYEIMFRTQRDPDAEDWSPHQRLVVQAMIMDLDMQRAWIYTARERLLAVR
ncbi:PadR family transcriptional regulator [Chloroflexota bacterium]